MFKTLLLLCFVGFLSAAPPTNYEYYTAGGIKSGLKADSDIFHLNGKPITLFSGSLHPFRVHQNKWKETLLKMRAAGLNAVQFYTAWNLHEPTPGNFDFESGMNNLDHFLTAVKEADMFAVFRPGPYICAEYEFGGFPAWLLRDPNMKLRTYHRPYLDAVDKYFSKLFAAVKKHQFSTNGGPIIAIQLENEYGGYDHNVDTVHKYLKELHDIATKSGLKELFFTCDNWVNKLGTMPGLFQSMNFGNNAVGHLKDWKKMIGHQPMYVSEFWTGWFDAWGEKHHRRSAADFAKELEGILIEMNSSVNFYMFIGGTNFGFNAGHGLITSYDYDAPLSESANYTDKYWKTKEIIEKFIKLHKYPEIRQPAPPKIEPYGHYGAVKITEELPMTEFLKHLKGYNSQNPIFSELLPVGPNHGQNVGFTLYRTTIPLSKSLKFTKGNIRDRAFPVIDGNEQIQPGLYPTDGKGLTLAFDSAKFAKNRQNHTLDILIENMGRHNGGGWMSTDNVHKEMRGMGEDVLIDDKVHHNWEIFPIEFKQDFIEKVRADKWSPIQGYKSPALFRGHFDIKDEPRDTFIRLDGWHTTNVFINGFNLGRYWNNGPQKTLYVPSPVLKKGVNEVMLFETYGSGTQVEFVDKPELG